MSDFEDGIINEDMTHGRKKYMIQLQGISNGYSNIMEIFYEDLEEYFRTEEDEDFLKEILVNTKRYISIFSEVADGLIPERNIPLSLDEVYHIKK